MSDGGPKQFRLEKLLRAGFAVIARATRTPS